MLKQLYVIRQRYWKTCLIISPFCYYVTLIPDLVSVLNIFLFFFSSVFSNELQETLPHDGLHVHVPEVQELGPLPTATQHAQPLKNAPPMTESLTGNRAMPAKVAGVPVPVSQIG